MRLTVIPGDGVGPEVMNSVIEILQTVKAPFEYDFQDAGEVALRKYNKLLPASTLASIDKSRLALKGPTTTQVGSGHRSINFLLRQKFDLYASVCPIKSLPAVGCVNEYVDLTIVRENTTDKITHNGSERIARYGYELAKKIGRKKVAIVHNAHNMNDFLFLDACLAVGKDYPEIETWGVFIDHFYMQLSRTPEQFEVILTENLDGETLSGLCASPVGGLGLVPIANIGDKAAIFEALHGSSPDVAGQNRANPTALLQSALLLLQHIGEIEKARAIHEAMSASLQDSSCCTADLGGKGNTQLFTKAIVQKLNC